MSGLGGKSVTTAPAEHRTPGFHQPPSRGRGHRTADTEPPTVSAARVAMTDARADRESLWDQGRQPQGRARAQARRTRSAKAAGAVR